MQFKQGLNLLVILIVKNILKNTYCWDNNWTKKFDRDCQVKLSLQSGLEAQKVEKHWSNKCLTQWQASFDWEKSSFCKQFPLIVRFGGKLYSFKNVICCLIICDVPLFSFKKAIWIAQPWWLHQAFGIDKRKWACRKFGFGVFWQL